MELMRRLLFIVLFVCTISFPAFASNCTNTMTCPADCPGAAGSLSFSPIANTAYTSPLGTSIPSTDCIFSIPYDSAGTPCPGAGGLVFNPGNCITAAFKPHGYAASSLFWIVCWHGGGGFGGLAEACFGGGNDTIAPIELVQRYLDTPNPVGGKGIGVVLVSYPISTSPGTATFPAQFRAVACSISWMMAGKLGATPSILGYYGPSWGGTLSFWAGNVPTSAYGASLTCLNPDRRPQQSRTVSAWPPMVWMQPAASSLWENGSYTDNGATAHEAMEDALNCSSLQTCYANDVSLNATPYLQINSGNLTQIESNAQMFQFGATDTLVQPYWSGNTGGQFVDPMQRYWALGIAPLTVVYPNCGHECDLGNVGTGTMRDALNFLLNTPTILTGGVTPVYSSATTIQPGSWISIFGINLASGTAIWNGDFPANLGGTTVTIDGKPAFLWFVSPQQINLQAPDDSNFKPVQVSVNTPSGTAISTTTLGAVSPSFLLLADGKHVTGIVPTPGQPGNSGNGYDIAGPARPVKAGEILVLYGVGFGPTKEVVPAGEAYQSATPTTNSVQVIIGGVTVPQVNVQFSGLVGAGLYQINVLIPENLGTGDKSIVASIGGVQTQSNVLVSLQ
jgi:uncharacterized protein (TIGR03437 family)